MQNAHPTPSNLAPFLARLNSRSILSDREQQRILDLPVRVRQVSANIDFVRMGERVDHASFVAAGLVGRFGQNARGARQITALHIPGDMPDLHSVVQPTATSALQALTTTTLLQVPHASLRSAAADFPAIAEALWRDTMVDAMILEQWVVNVGRRDARSRIAHLLCELARRYHAPRRNGQVTFHLPMTQAHMADATGLTPVHVNRVIKSLASVGVTIRAKRVSIDDWEALVEVADFDAGYLQADVGQEQRIRIIN